MTAHVFMGPTWPAPDVAHSDLVFLPPAAFGDVIRSVRAGAQAILIVDGYFDHRPAVWHKEILWALHQGVNVFGASSMGALRAAELDAFGMVGVGEVYRQFASGALEDDDEVAVVHGPADTDFCASSEALVNVRATLALAVRQRVCQEHDAAAIVRACKQLFYPERTWPALLDAASTADVPLNAIAALRDWLPAHRVDQKRLDASAALGVVAQWLLGPRRRHVARFHFEATDAWCRALETVGDGGATLAGPSAASLRDSAWWATVGRGLALQRASALAVEPDEAALRMAVDALCRRADLRDAQAFHDWARARGLDRESLWRFIREEAQLAWLVESLEPVWRASTAHQQLHMDLEVSSSEGKPQR